MDPRDGFKKRAAERALEFVSDGMVVGLGTGSTAAFAVQGIGELMRQGMSLQCVPTSRATEEMARALGIPLVGLNDLCKVDVTIDGADEVDPGFHMIKGGGGALTREKLVAQASSRLVIVVDPSKMVERLGSTRQLPVEVLPFAWCLPSKKLVEMGCAPHLRGGHIDPFVTDNGNYILDCDFGPIDRPAELEKAIRLIPGVVESGLFVGLADVVIIGSDDGVEVRERPAV